MLSSKEDMLCFRTSRQRYGMITQQIYLDANRLAKQFILLLQGSRQMNSRMLKPSVRKKPNLLFLFLIGNIFQKFSLSVATIPDYEYSVNSVAALHLVHRVISKIIKRVQWSTFLLPIKGFCVSGLEDMLKA